MLDLFATMALVSFIDVPSHHPFPIQNLPYTVGVLSNYSSPHCFSRIGDWVIDLAVLESEGVFEEVCVDLGFTEATLNTFMNLPPSVWTAVRTQLQWLLSAENPQLRDNVDLRQRVFAPITQFTYVFPVQIGDFTDFYASKHHAFNVGALFRGPGKELQPNWIHLPTGYNGRASSVRLSGTPVRRPRGQVNSNGTVAFVQSQKLDFESELGYFIGGPGNEIGEPIAVDQAEEHVFGMVLLNDWSARDIQAWEYVPLGPFTSKNFLTTISPWIVTRDALEVCKMPLPLQDPQPLAYLRPKQLEAYNITLETYLRSDSLQETQVSASNMMELYWSVKQQVAQLTVTGSSVRTGDLIGTGTISGASPESAGCLLERTSQGPLLLPNGEERTFLSDGDEVILRGYCRTSGYTIGFGEARGVVFPAWPA